MEKKTKTKRLAIDALLSAVALIIFTIELQFPSLTPIPGIKLGLANIITLMAIFLLGPIDALYVLLVRIFLGCLLTGQIMALAYSLAGGALSFVVMLIFRRFITNKQIFVCSIFGAMAHNIGQILIAVVITQTTQVAYYLPILMVSSIITGLFTGLAAQYTVIHLRNIKKY